MNVCAEADAEDFKLQTRVGQLLFRLERYREASDCFRAALNSDTENTDLLFKLGRNSMPRVSTR